MAPVPELLPHPWSPLAQIQENWNKIQAEIGAVGTGHNTREYDLKKRTNFGLERKGYSAKWCHEHLEAVNSDKEGIPNYSQ